MNFDDVHSNNLSIPLSDFGKSYERLEEHPQESKYPSPRNGKPTKGSLDIRLQTNGLHSDFHDFFCYLRNRG